LVGGGVGSVGHGWGLGRGKGEGGRQSLPCFLVF
jgi:hypothetical protein